MSSKTLAKYGSEGRVDCMFLDPNGVTIAEDDPEHPHYARHEARRKINEKMVRSIMRWGVKEVIKVYHDGEQVIAATGRRRLRHARIANERLLAEGKNPVKMRAVVCADPHTDKLLENHHRMGESPLVEAKDFADEISRGTEFHVACEMFDLPKKRGEKLLALLRMPLEIQQAVDQRKMSLGVALGLKGGVIGQGKKAAALTEAGLGRGELGAEAARRLNRGESLDRPVLRMIPRRGIERLSASLTGETQALLRFLLGEHAALDEVPALKGQVVAAGWDPEKGRFRRAKTDAQKDTTEEAAS